MRGKGKGGPFHKKGLPSFERGQVEEEKGQAGGSFFVREVS